MSFSYDKLIDFFEILNLFISHNEPWRIKDPKHKGKVIGLSLTSLLGMVPYFETLLPAFNRDCYETFGEQFILGGENLEACFEANQARFLAEDLFSLIPIQNIRRQKA